MKPFQFLYYIITISLLLVNICAQSHGVSAFTKVYTQQNGHLYMQALCERVCSNKKPALYSYQLAKRSKRMARATSAGRSVTNCYYEISFDNNCRADISCTPVQQFFLADTHARVAAHELQVGDRLIGYHGAYTITNLRFVPQRLNIFSITVEPTHTFYIGEHKILTHNMPLLFCFSVSVAFGSGAAEGATAGSFFGPIGMGVGAVVGGLIGIAVKKYMNHYQIPSYDDISFDVTFLQRDYYQKELAKKQKQESQKSNNNKEPEKPRKKNIEYTPAQLKEQAAKNGYKRTTEGNFDSHNAIKFKKNNRIITPDRTKHKGGIWKEFNMKNDRVATLDWDFNPIAD